MLVVIFLPLVIAWIPTDTMGGQTSLWNAFETAFKPPVQEEESYWTHLSRNLNLRQQGQQLILKFNAENVEEVAEELLMQSAAWFRDEEPWWSPVKTVGPSDLTAERTQALGTVMESMKSFVAYCEKHLEEAETFKIKLVASQGRTATQCPSWHTDWVPIRGIQTLRGPGTVYLDPKHVTPELLPAFRGGDCTPEEKDTMIKASGIPFSHATGLQFMVGHRWNEKCRPEFRGKPRILHRSPRNVPWQQARVMIVLDVVDCDCCDD